MKTLITGGKSAQALKLLKAFSGDQVLLADYGEIPSFISSNYHFVSLGDRNDDTIAHTLLNACLDQEADRLVPIYHFELEAVMKSALLFEEFNVHVLLPGNGQFESFSLAAAGNPAHWVVYDRGSLVYASDPATGALSHHDGLNGVFYISQSDQGPVLTLFNISDGNTAV